jgi:hypothetical protein
MTTHWNQVDIDIKSNPESPHDFGQIRCSYGIGGECETEIGYGYHDSNAPLFIDGHITNSQIFGIVPSQDENFYYGSTGAEWSPLGVKGKIESNFMGIHLGVQAEAKAGVGYSIKGGLAKWDERKFGVSINGNVAAVVGGGATLNAYFDANEFESSCKNIEKAVTKVVEEVSIVADNAVETSKVIFNDFENRTIEKFEQEKTINCVIDRESCNMNKIEHFIWVVGSHFF